VDEASSVRLPGKKRKRRRPKRYTFTLRDKTALTAFVRRQRVPPHDHPRRRIRLERWIVGHYLLALFPGSRLCNFLAFGLIGK
jgi:hypothetical protein